MSDELGFGVDILVDRATEADKDAALAQAIAESPVPVVLAHAARADGLDAAQAGFLDGFMAASKAISGHPVLARDADGTVRRWPPGGRKGAAAPPTA